MDVSRSLFAAGIAAFVVACSSGDSDGTTAPVAGDPAATDDGADVDAGATPPPSKKKDAGPPAPPPPQPYPTIESRGGNVIASPKVVPITFSNDRFAPNVEDFVPRMSGSRYWDTIN